MAAAKESELGELHNAVARVMRNALTATEKQQEAYDVKVQIATDAQDPELMPEFVPEVNPALLSVITRFLDSNKITCVPEAGNVMGELEKQLAAKKERRAARKAVGNVVQLHEGEE
ncbi:terminase small subunit protein [Rhizobium phage RHph_X3_9]|nr:terminase small subunit protein [Rhizobium phage RHph_X3_9]